MNDRYYYSIAGEVSSEPVTLMEVPDETEYICREGSDVWERFHRGNRSRIVRFFGWFIATQARAKATAQVALVCFCAGIAIWLVAQYAAAMPNTQQPAGPQQPLDARVSVDGMFLRVDVRDDHAGRPLMLHLNGSPGMRGTYRNEVTWPDDSNAALIPLADFVRGDGQYFNPVTHRPTEVWVGGGGYAHQQYRF